MSRWLRYTRLLITTTSLLQVSIGCRTPDEPPGDESRLASTDEADYAFCQLSQAGAPNRGSSATWNAARVQQEIRSLLGSQAIKGTPWAAYPALYLRMTAQRDIERCGGRLQSASREAQLIGDRLADLMTRFYVLETSQCASSETPDQAAGFCALMRRARAERYDSLSAAMASTAIYISSHIASSLRAVASDEPFWQSLGVPDTLQADPARAMQARIVLLKAYRPDYDRFNGFLADQLATVVGALTEERLLGNGALAAAAGLAKHISFRSCFFSRIRDMAFTAAIEDAAERGGRDHPMLVPAARGYRVDPSRYDFSRPLTARERAVEEYALDAVAGPAQRLIYQHLLGGRSWDELRRDGEITASCLP